MNESENLILFYLGLNIIFRFKQKTISKPQVKSFDPEKIKVCCIPYANRIEIYNSQLGTATISVVLWPSICQGRKENEQIVGEILGRRSYLTPWRQIIEKRIVKFQIFLIFTLMEFYKFFFWNWSNLIKAVLKINTVPTHNKHVFVRPKKVC